jgi:hypothetical protein
MLTCPQSFFFLGRTEFRTQGKSTLQKQVLYCLNHTRSPYSLISGKDLKTGSVTQDVVSLIIKSYCLLEMLRIICTGKQCCSIEI